MPVEKSCCEPQVQSGIGPINYATSERRESVAVENGGAKAVEKIKSSGKTLNVMAVAINTFSFSLIG